MISNHQLNLSTKRTVHTSCLCKFASCARPTSSCRFYCLWKNSLLLINTKLPVIALEIMFFPTQIGLGMILRWRIFRFPNFHFKCAN